MKHIQMFLSRQLLKNILLIMWHQVELSNSYSCNKVIFNFTCEASQKTKEKIIFLSIDEFCMCETACEMHKYELLIMRDLFMCVREIGNIHFCWTIFTDSHQLQLMKYSFNACVLRSVCMAACVDYQCPVSVWWGFRK